LQRNDEGSDEDVPFSNSGEVQSPPLRRPAGVPKSCFGFRGRDYRGVIGQIGGEVKFPCVWADKLVMTLPMRRGGGESTIYEEKKPSLIEGGEGRGGFAEAKRLMMVDQPQINRFFFGREG